MTEKKKGDRTRQWSERSRTRESIGPFLLGGRGDDQRQKALLEALKAKIQGDET